MTKINCAYCRKEIDNSDSKFSLILHHPHYPLSNPLSETIVCNEKEAYLFLVKKYDKEFHEALVVLKIIEKQRNELDKKYANLSAKFKKIRKALKDLNIKIEV